MIQSLTIHTASLFKETGQRKLTYLTQATQPERRGHTLFLLANKIVRTLQGDVCNLELNRPQGKYLLFVNDKRHEMQTHVRTTKLGKRGASSPPWASTHAPAGCPFPFAYLSSGADHQCVAQHSPFVFFSFKRGHRSHGLTHHPTQIIKTGWVGLQEEDEARPDQSARLLANISCQEGWGDVHSGSI